MIERLLRGAAVAIALAAVFDPACSIESRSRPTLSIEIVDAPSMALPADGSSRRAVAEQARRSLAARLARQFEVVDGPASAAVARVVIGDQWPVLDSSREAGKQTIPTYAVNLASNVEPNVRITSLQAPARITVWDRAAIVAGVEGRGLQGREVDLRLLQGGVEVAKVTHRWRSQSDNFEARLTFVPSVEGPHMLEVVASSSKADSERSDLDNRVSTLVVADAAVRPVLVYQSRPSWMATFVARALERDPRIALSSLTNVSTRIEVTATTKSGERPGALDQATAVDSFDVVVVGAPDVLTRTEAASLERYVRQRGGSAVLLADRKPAGPMLELSPADAFEEVLLQRPAALTRGLRASELSIPARVRSGWETLAADGGRPVVLATPLGHGHVVFSGALDAWRHREGSRYWTDLIASYAALTPRPVSVRFEPRIARPGDPIEIVAEVIASEPAIDQHVGLIARMGKTPVRLWPGGEPGLYRGAARAPLNNGVAMASLEHAGVTATAALLVNTSVAQPWSERDAPLEAIATASGGRTVRAGDVDRLATALERHARPATTVRALRPLRSAWWMLPFAGCLAAEWALRRRRHLH
jgi:hypothetical protein